MTFKDYILKKVRLYDARPTRLPDILNDIGLELGDVLRMRDGQAIFDHFSVKFNMEQRRELVDLVKGYKKHCHMNNDMFERIKAKV